MFDVSSSKPTLLVIDDIPENLTLMYQLLKEDYKVKGATRYQYCGNGKPGSDSARYYDA